MITHEVETFERLIRAVCPVRLGNVEFWIDSDGPWVGKLTFSIPTSQWDTAALSRDLQAKLIESGFSV